MTLRHAQKLTGSETKEKEPHTHQNAERKALCFEGEYLHFCF